MVKNNILNYRKLFFFSFFYLSQKNSSPFKILVSFIRIIKFLNCIQKFFIFLPSTFNMNTAIFQSCWMDGYITNFRHVRWHLLGFIRIQKLPSILLNLTSNLKISFEITKKKLPLISLYKNTYFYNDYSVTGNSFFFKNNLDHTYFFIFLLNFIKKFQNV